MRLNIQSKWLEKYAPSEKNPIAANGRTPLLRARNAHHLLIGRRGKPNSPNSSWKSQQRKAVSKTTQQTTRADQI